LDEAAAKAEADSLRAGSSAAQAKAAAKRVRFEAAQAPPTSGVDADAAAGQAAVASPGGAAPAAGKGGKPPLDVSTKPLPLGPFKSKFDKKDDLLTLLTPGALRKYTPQAHRELTERVAVWRSHPTTWMRRGDWFRERENVVLAVRWCGVRVSRPPRVET
jgi:hypothetical protein